MPGTGKTYVIVMLLKIMVEKGLQILLSSYTHSALDNILKRFVEKFPNLKNKITRIASNPTQVDEKVQDLVFQKKKCKSLKDIKEYFEPKQIFAVTCLASSNLILSNSYQIFL